MADIQSNIKVNIDTTEALASIKLLQGQISAFHTQMAKSGAAANVASSGMQQNLINSLNATGKFSASMTTVKTTTESFTTALEKNKLSMGEYFKYSIASSKSFGRIFQNEFETINKVARERVKDLQTQYIKLGRDANGAMKAISVRPLMLDLENLGTKTQIAAQRQAILNQLLKQGSTNLLNFGKNTQWAGRQLMVGFTIPLSMAGAASIKAYMQIEKSAVAFKRVYGDLNTTAKQANDMARQVEKLAASYTKYGVAVADTMDMAAKAAAMGKQGADLLAQIDQATKLSVLGGVDQKTALDTTISLTNAFGISTAELTKKINFLNVVENQTVLSIEDMTTAIPKAAPVVKQLGGNVEDLAYFLTAMKEGGISASEGANALKSGLASLINPTKKSSDFLASFGVNVKNIVNNDKGNLKKTVLDFATALNTLDPLNRAKAIEMMFGKFQFARMSTLLKNVTDQSSQAAKVMGLANQSSIQLAAISNRELAKVQSSPLYKFQKAIADIQLKIAPIGQSILKIITPILNFATKMLDGFNHMNDGFKNFILVGSAIGGIIAPALLMVVGLVANGAANVLKFFTLIKNFFNKTATASEILGEQTDFLTQEQLKAKAAAASLDQVHGKLRQTFTAEAESVDILRNAYQKATLAQEAFSGTRHTPTKTSTKAYASGGLISGPGTGTSDSILARVSNGEAIIPAASVARNPNLVGGLISGNIPGFSDGGPEEILKKLKIAKKGRNNNVSDDTQISSTSSIQQGHLEDAALKTADEIITSVKHLGQTVVNEVTNKLKEKQNILISGGMSQEDAKNYKFTAYAEGLARQPIKINNKGNASFKVAEATDFYQKQGSHAFDNLARHLNDAGIPADKIKKVLEQASSNLVESLGKLNQSAHMSVNELNKMTNASIDVATSEKELNNVVKQTRSTYPTILNPDTTNQRAILATQYSYKNKNKRTANLAETILGINEGAYETKANITTKQLAQVGSEYSPRTIKAGLQVLQKSGDELSAKADQFIQRLANMGKNVATELPIIISELDATLKGSALPELKNVANYVINGYMHDLNSSLAKAYQTASPSKLEEKLSKDRADGTIKGVKESLPKIEEQGKQQGLSFGKAAADAINQRKNDFKSAVTSSYTVTPAIKQYLQEQSKKIFRPYLDEQGKLIKVSIARVKVLSKEEIAIRQLAQAEEQAAIAAEQAAIANQQQANSQQTSPNVIDTASSNKKSKFSTAGKIAGGISTAAMMGSMLPGQIGQISQIIATVGFAFSGIEGILAAFGTTLGAVVSGLGVALPVIGVLALAITGGVIAFNAYADAEKKRKQQINALGDAAKTTAGEISTLEQLTGSNLSALPSSQIKKGTLSIVGSKSGGQQFQQDVSTLMNSDLYKNDPDIQKIIKTLKTSKAGDAKAILRGKYMTLVGMGMDPASASAYISALQASSGKDFGFTQTNIGLDSKQGIAGQQKSIAQGTKSFAKRFNNGYKTTSQDVTDVFAANINSGKEKLKYNQKLVFDDITGHYKLLTTNMTDSFKSAYKKITQSTTDFITGLGGQFKNGTISAKQFDTQFGSMSKHFKEMALSNPSAALSEMHGVMLALNPELAAASQSIQDMNTYLLILQAGALNVAGVIELTALIAKGGKAGKDAEELLKTRLNNEKITDAAQAKANAAQAKADAATTTAQDKQTASLQKQIDLINKKKKALEDVNTELDRQKQFEDAQTQRSMDAKQAMISGDYVKAAMLKQESQYNKTKFDNQTKTLEYDKQIAALEQKIQDIQKNTSAISSSSSTSNPTSESNKVDSTKLSGYKDTTQQEAQLKQDIKNSKDQNYALAPENFPDGKIIFSAQRLKDLGILVTAKGQYFGYHKAQYKVLSILGDQVSTNLIKKYATGGHISGPGSKTSDSIPAMLSNGEYVIKASTVDKVGVPFLNNLNTQKFANGGFVQRMKDGGSVNTPSISTLTTPGGAIGYGLQQIMNGIYSNLFGSGTMKALKTNDISKIGFDDLLTFGMNAFTLPGFGTMAKGVKGFAQFIKAIPKIPKALKYQKAIKQGMTIDKNLVPSLDNVILNPGRHFTSSQNFLKFEDNFQKIPIGETKISANENFYNLLENLKYERVKTNSNPYNLKTYNLSDTGLWKTKRTSLFKTKVHPLQVEATSELYSAISKRKEEKFKGLINATLDSKNKTLGDPIYGPENVLTSKLSDATLKNYVKVLNKNKSEILAGGTTAQAVRSKFAQILSESESTDFEIFHLGRAEAFDNSINNLERLLYPVSHNNFGTLEHKPLLSFMYPEKMINSTKQIYTKTKNNITKKINLFKNFKGLGSFLAESGNEPAHNFLKALNPSGIEALAVTRSAITRSENAIPDLIHPKNVPMVNGRVFGPGVYAGTTKFASDKYFSEFGRNKYKFVMSPSMIKRILSSKGYANDEIIGNELSKIGFNPANVSYGINQPWMKDLQNTSWESQIIQNLLKQGYIGYKHNDAITNWILGVEHGLGLKNTETNEIVKIKNDSSQLNGMTGINELIKIIASKYAFEKSMKMSKVGTRIKSDTLLSMLKNKDFKYRSASETGTGADHINARTGQFNLEGKRNRLLMEEDIFGIPYAAGAENRPTYGSVATLNPFIKMLNQKFGGIRGKQFNDVTNPMSNQLDVYGDVSLIGKRTLNNRSSIFGKDLLESYIQLPQYFKNRAKAGIKLPGMVGSTEQQLFEDGHMNILDNKFGTYTKNPDGSMTYNTGTRYLETQTFGGFNLNEISKIITKNPELAPIIRKALKQSGLKIPVRSANTGLLSKLRGYSDGGLVSGAGNGTSDSILARISNGEYVMKASAVKNIGVDNLHKLNSTASNDSISHGDSVYNINMTINGGNANAKDIADMVIKKLDTIGIKNNKTNMVGR